MPTQQQIYARRRFLALIVILLVAAGVFFANNNPFGSSTPVLTVSESTESATVSQNTSEVVDCAPGVVSVEVKIGNETETLNTFAADAKPLIWYAITNTGLEPCNFNVGARVTFFTITSGEQTYWSSRDCDRSADVDSVITLPSNQTVEAARSIWDRVYSSENGCNAETNDAVPGGGATYRIKAEVNGVISEDKTFILN